MQGKSSSCLSVGGPAVRPSSFGTYGRTAFHVPEGPVGVGHVRTQLSAERTVAVIAVAAHGVEEVSFSGQAEGLALRSASGRDCLVHGSQRRAAIRKGYCELCPGKEGGRERGR